MNDRPGLDEWVAMTPEERNGLRRAWSGYDEYFLEQDWLREEGYWLVLLEEAAKRFKVAYGGHPLINHVAHTPSLTASSPYEPAIIVTTALSTLQRIEELPDRYMTFAVYQEPIADSKRFYLRTWELVLGHFLGWSGERVREWARQKWEDGLNGVNGMFYHELPAWYVSGLLVPPDVRARLAPLARHHINNRVAIAIGEPLSIHPYDWEAAKESVRRVIEEALKERA